MIAKLATGDAHKNFLCNSTPEQFRQPNLYLYGPLAQLARAQC